MKKYWQGKQQPAYRSKSNRELLETIKEIHKNSLYIKSVEQMQEDLDFYMLQYNEERTHQGKRCKGRTPMQTFLDSLPPAREKLLNDPTS